jgi:hypothetical protein
MKRFFATGFLALLVVGALVVLAGAGQNQAGSEGKDKAQCTMAEQLAHAGMMAKADQTTEGNACGTCPATGKATMAKPGGSAADSCPAMASAHCADKGSCDYKAKAASGDCCGTCGGGCASKASTKAGKQCGTGGCGDKQAGPAMHDGVKADNA